MLPTAADHDARQLARTRPRRYGNASNDPGDEPCVYGEAHDPYRATGGSKARVTLDLLELLSVTENHLAEIYDISFLVIVSP